LTCAKSQNKVLQPLGGLQLPHQSSYLTTRGLNDVDRTFVEYSKAKKARIAGIPGHNTSHNQRSEALKMFPLSMLPDLELMTDEQIRQFMRKSLQTIDDIMLLCYGYRALAQ
jgi:hypothetical protein